MNIWRIPCNLKPQKLYTMKKLITLSAFGFTLLFTVSVSAQENQKPKTNKTTPTVTKQEVQNPKSKTDKTTPVSTNKELKQETKTEVKGDTTKKPGGTRMAINNKGLPSKNKKAPAAVNESKMEKTETEKK